MKRINWLWATRLIAIWMAVSMSLDLILGIWWLAGLSATLGVAGTGFGRLNYRHQVAARERPFRDPRVSSDIRHAACLAETNRMERELGLLSALSESEFDRAVERAIGKREPAHEPIIPNVNAALGPVSMASEACCDEHSEQWWREKAWDIWRRERRS